MSPSLADIWPEVAPKLYASLRARAVRPAVCEEAIQEVGVRALSSGVTYTSAQDFYRWARAVAHNYVTDLRRRGELLSFVELGHASEHTPHHVDASVHAEARLRLEELWHVIASMSPLDQRALVLPLSNYTPTSERECNYWATRRRRARHRLNELLDGAVAGLGLVGWRWRWRWRGRVGQLAAPAGALAVALVLPGAMHTVRPPVTTPAPHVVAGASGGPVPELAERQPEGTSSTVSQRSDRAPVRHTGTGAVSPPAASTPPTGPRPLVDVRAPGGSQLADAYSEEPGPDEHLVCVGNLRVVGKVCAGAPLR